MLKNIKQAIHPYRQSSLFRALNPRSFVCYGVGLEKSGTHSLAAMLEDHYRSTHEENVNLLNNTFIDVAEGKKPTADLKEEIDRRDLYGWLEMDASHPHVHYLDLLLEKNPDAKVILTIRDCYSWLNSVINQHIYAPKRQYFERLHAFRYRENRELYQDFDQFLKSEYELPSATAYLAFWTHHINRVRSLASASQLLIVRTPDLRKSAAEIAAFLEISERSISTEKSHAYRAQNKDPVLSRMGAEGIQKLADEHCGDLMAEFFSDKDYLVAAMASEQK
ncbi:sulfotransferase domain-containing protein [bacterium]|nr:sulfotransferase domain-containing protein [bacterium]